MTRFCYDFHAIWISRWLWEKVIIFAATLGSILLALTDFAARVFQIVSYVFHHCPFPTLNFCAEKGSRKLAVFITTSLFSHTHPVVFHSRTSCSMQNMYQGKVGVSFSCSTFNGTMKPAHNVTDYKGLCLLIWYYRFNLKILLKVVLFGRKDLQAFQISTFF